MATTRPSKPTSPLRWLAACCPPAPVFSAPTRLADLVQRDADDEQLRQDLKRAREDLADAERRVQALERRLGARKSEGVEAPTGVDDAGAKVDEEAANASNLLGVSLAWAVGSFSEVAWSKMQQKAAMASKTREDLDKMNFIELKEVVAMTDTGIGYGQVCPRDGELHCSIVDGLHREKKSARATIFMSWVWRYELKQVLSALQSWQERNRHGQGLLHFIWWCFFCNNQFRLHSETGGSKSLAEIFGTRLSEVGKMLVMLDELGDPGYTKRAWCLFEVWVACRRSINIQIALSQDGVDKFQEATAKGDFQLDACLSIDSTKAEATMPEDQAFIMSQMAAHHKEVDQKVKDALLRLLRDLVEDLSTGHDEQPKPAEIRLEMMTDILKKGQKTTTDATQKDLIMLMGNTGSGKSTTMNFLQGCRMVRAKDSKGSSVIKVAEDSAVQEVACIGHTSHSETPMPSLYPIRDRPPLVFCDCPGFADTRGPETSIATAVNLHHAMRVAASVRVLVALEYASVTASRGRGLKELQHLLLDVFGTKEQLKQHEGAVLLCITKAPRRDEDGQAVKREDIMSHFRHLGASDALYSICHNFVVYHPLEREHTSWLNSEELFAAVTGLNAIQAPSDTCFLALPAEDKWALDDILKSFKCKFEEHFKASKFEEAAKIFRGVQGLTHLLFHNAKLHSSLQRLQLEAATLVGDMKKQGEADEDIKKRFEAVKDESDDEDEGKPPLPAALLFPGQGSQYPGMLKDCVNLPAVKDMLTKAEKILGWDVKELCLKGPEDKLSETKYCQPAMFIAGLCAVEVLRESKKDVVERSQAVAGLSLGEYTAICAAGVLDFEDALTLVKTRAEAMQKATEAVPQCMCSVAGLDRPTLEKLCKEAREADEAPDATCQIANVLFPMGFTCAGNKTAVDKLCQLATKARALQARVIKAGGAFHTPLMKPAEDELAKAIDKAAPKMKPPRCCIYFNTTGKKVAPGTSPADFAELMKKQLTNEVLWEPTIKQMIMDQVEDFYECGPAKQLKAMIKRIDQDAFKRTVNVSV